MFAVMRGLVDAAREDNCVMFHEALYPLTKFNVHFVDVLKFLILFHHHMTINDAVLDVPYECIGYMLWGPPYAKFQQDVNCSLFTTLVTSMISTAANPITPDTLLAASYGFRRVRDIYLAVASRWDARPPERKVCLIVHVDVWGWLRSLSSMLLLFSQLFDLSAPISYHLHITGDIHGA